MQLFLRNENGVLNRFWAGSRIIYWTLSSFPPLRFSAQMSYSILETWHSMIEYHLCHLDCNDSWLAKGRPICNENILLFPQKLKDLLCSWFQCLLSHPDRTDSSQSQQYVDQRLMTLPSGVSWSRLTKLKLPSSRLMYLFRTCLLLRCRMGDLSPCTVPSLLSNALEWCAYVDTV